jgi:hypothetical protein
MKMIDITGKKYGRLTALSFAGVDSGKRTKWYCRCECGNTIIVDGWKMRNGHTQSCGCLQAERTAQANKRNNTKHGMSAGSKRKGHPLYKIWRGMIDRCENPNVHNYQYYGARGISVCKEWRVDFMAFYNWAIASGYKTGLSIDRIDVNANYCPENCRWATAIQQANNKRNSIRRTA